MQRIRGHSANEPFAGTWRFPWNIYRAKDFAKIRGEEHVKDNQNTMDRFDSKRSAFPEGVC
jgi:hypothetical protein